MFLLNLNLVLVAQQDLEPNVNLEINGITMNDSIVFLDVSLINKTGKDIVIDNPDFYLIKSRNYDFFWIPDRWDILIMNEKAEQCFSEGRFIQISKTPKEVTKTIKGNQEFSFQIPININRLNCMSDSDFSGNFTRKGPFEFQLKIGFIEPKDVEIESNKVTFELKEATSKNTL